MLKAFKISRKPDLILNQRVDSALDLAFDSSSDFIEREDGVSDQINLSVDLPLNLHDRAEWFEFGIGVSQNYQKAVQNYQESYRFALISLGQGHRRQIDRSETPEEISGRKSASRIFLVFHGNTEADWRMRPYFSERLKCEDILKIVDPRLCSSELFLLGRHHELSNHNLAISAYRMAAVAGHPGARYWLAWQNKIRSVLFTSTNASHVYWQAFKERSSERASRHEGGCVIA